MILQSLYKRYTTLASDPQSGIAEPYTSVVKVSFALEISEDGELVQVVDLRTEENKKLRPIHMAVPEQDVRSSGIKPYFLCDKSDYLLGYGKLDSKKNEERAKKDLIDRFEASKKLHHELLATCTDSEAVAVLRFFDRWQPALAPEHPALKPILSVLEKGTDNVFVFRLRHHPRFVHQNEEIRKKWITFRQAASDSANVVGQCLVSGEFGQPVARIHGKIKGVKNAEASGANLVSFNSDSFESYGKTQSYNAPVSEQVAFGYVNALNHLLSSRRHCLTDIGDMTVVFWAEKSAGNQSEDVEDLFRNFMLVHSDQEQWETETRLKDLFKRIREGKPLTTEMLQAVEVPFYVLGLSPNKSRISVRFYWQGHFGSLADKLVQHASDLTIAGESDNGPPSIYRLLVETVPKQVKSPYQQISPTMSGALFRAIIQGGMYPRSLFNAILNRIRADGDVNAVRAAAIKAYLLRYARIHGMDSLKGVISVALNTQTNDPAYRLGRLFAVLEKAQADAAGGYSKLNATIKDRYFGAASSSPASVFPLLLRLSQHHIAKSDYGRIRDMEIQEIMSGLDRFPSHLNLQQQGLFVLGYYHQKETFFAKKEDVQEKGDDAHDSEQKV